MERRGWQEGGMSEPMLLPCSCPTAVAGVVVVVWVVAMMAATMLRVVTVADHSHVKKMYWLAEPP